MGRRRPVEADADADVLAGEALDGEPVQQRRVGLHGYADRGPVRHLHAHGRSDGGKEVRTRQQGLAPVEHDLHAPEVVGTHVLGDALSRVPDGCRGHAARLSAPTLVDRPSET